MACYIRSIYLEDLDEQISVQSAKVLCKVWLDQDDEELCREFILQCDHAMQSQTSTSHKSIKYYILLEALANNALHSLNQFCEVIQKWGIVQSNEEGPTA